MEKNVYFLELEIRNYFIDKDFTDSFFNHFLKLINFILN